MTLLLRTQRERQTGKQRASKRSAFPPPRWKKKKGRVKRKEKMFDPIQKFFSLFALMLPPKDAAGAADDPPLSATEISQAFEKAQREREAGQQEEGDRGGEEKDEASGESGAGLDLDRGKKRGGGAGGRWRQAFLRCFCGAGDQ